MPLIHGERDPYLSCPPVVQVPDGMTADEARQILADHRPWVEVADKQRANLAPGARLRIEWLKDGNGSRTYAHPDDVLDADADLIHDLAQCLRDAWQSVESWGHTAEASDVTFDQLARKVIERVRADA